jgi:hypothetical protein
MPTDTTVHDRRRAALVPTACCAAFVLGLALVLAALGGCLEPGVIEAAPIDWDHALSADNPDAERLVDPMVGVALHHPRQWKVTRDPVLFDTHGFVLTDPTGAEAGDVHGNLPVVRVARDHAGGPADLEARVAALLAEFPEAGLERAAVTAGGHRAVAVGPVPGALPSIHVFVATEGELYRIVYFADELDDRGRAVLAGLELLPPTQPIESLRLRPVEEARFGLRGGPEPLDPKGGEAAAPQPVAFWEDFFKGKWASW